MKLSTKLALTLFACTQLSGCFFIFIPGSVIDKGTDLVTGNRGEHCIGEVSKVGDRIRIAGRDYTVMQLEGSSRRCQNPAFPQRAVLRYHPDATQ